MEAVRQAGTELMPVDSEHSAVFQAIAGADPAAIERIVLTASGGPFRTWSLEQLAHATPEQALRHPNWSMGRKITIDSATLMNKGLELIEAYHLFPVEPDQLEVVVHPQSIIHALVGFRDGSMLAQLASPDMRTPIALGLAWPARMAAPTKRIDLVELGTLELRAARRGAVSGPRARPPGHAAGGMAPAVLNAANEIAVEAFLTRTARVPSNRPTCSRDAGHGRRARAAGRGDGPGRGAGRGRCGAELALNLLDRRCCGRRHSG